MKGEAKGLKPPAPFTDSNQNDCHNSIELHSFVRIERRYLALKQCTPSITFLLFVYLRQTLARLSCYYMWKKKRCSKNINTWKTDTNSSIKDKESKIVFQIMIH